MRNRDRFLAAQTRRAVAEHRSADLERRFLGRQEDLLGGPATEHFERERAAGAGWQRQLSRYLRATTIADIEDGNGGEEGRPG